MVSFLILALCISVTFSELSPVCVIGPSNGALALSATQFYTNGSTASTDQLATFTTQINNGGMTRNGDRLYVGTSTKIIELDLFDGTQVDYTFTTALSKTINCMAYNCDDHLIYFSTNNGRDLYSVDISVPGQVNTSFIGEIGSTNWLAAGCEFDSEGNLYGSGLVYDLITIDINDGSIINNYELGDFKANSMGVNPSNGNFLLGQRNGPFEVYEVDITVNPPVATKRNDIFPTSNAQQWLDIELCQCIIDGTCTGNEEADPSKGCVSIISAANNKKLDCTWICIAQNGANTEFLIQPIINIEDETLYRIYNVKNGGYWKALDDGTLSSGSTKLDGSLLPENDSSLFYIDSCTDITDPENCFQIQSYVTGRYVNTDPTRYYPYVLRSDVEDKNDCNAKFIIQTCD